MHILVSCRYQSRNKAQYTTLHLLFSTIFLVDRATTGYSAYMGKNIYVWETQTLTLHHLAKGKAHFTVVSSVNMQQHQHQPSPFMCYPHSLQMGKEEQRMKQSMLQPRFFPWKKTAFLGWTTEAIFSICFICRTPLQIQPEKELHEKLTINYSSNRELDFLPRDYPSPNLNKLFSQVRTCLTGQSPVLSFVCERTISDNLCPWFSRHCPEFTFVISYKMPSLENNCLKGYEGPYMSTKPKHQVWMIIIYLPCQIILHHQLYTTAWEQALLYQQTLLSKGPS